MHSSEKSTDRCKSTEFWSNLPTLRYCSNTYVSTTSMYIGILAQMMTILKIALKTEDPPVLWIFYIYYSTRNGLKTLLKDGNGSTMINSQKQNNSTTKIPILAKYSAKCRALSTWFHYDNHDNFFWQVKIYLGSNKLRELESRLFSLKHTLSRVVQVGSGEN